MRWLWFVGSMVCLVVLFRTHSVGLAIFSLIGAFVCTIVGVLAVAAQRIESRRQDLGRILGPEEIRQLRMAEARRRAAAASPPDSPDAARLTSDPDNPDNPPLYPPTREP